MTVTGSSLPWITMFSQPLVFEGALHLCFAVSERASKIPSIRTASWLFWLKCWRLRLIIICSLVDYAIDMSLPWDLDVICLCGLLVILLKFWLWDIVAKTRSNRVRQSFSFVSLSLSTELLEDKQGFKLGGVDTSLSYLLFWTLLPLFWTLICMIWMELTRTNAVFSRIAMVLFYVQKTKDLGMTWNSTEYLRINNKKSLPKMKTRGPTPFPWGWPPLGRAPYLVGPLETSRLQLQLYIYLLSGRKK